MAERARAPKGNDDEISKIAESKRKANKAAKSAKAKAGHNSGEVPDEVYDRHLEVINVREIEMEKAKAEYDQKRGEFRAAFKAAKDDGCNLTAIRDARAAHRSDHNTTLQNIHDTGRVLRIMKSPLHTQFSLFSDVQPPKITNPVLAGQAAGKRGDDRTSNPHTPGSDDFQLWDDAWFAEQSKIAQKMGGGEGTPAH